MPMRRRDFLRIAGGASLAWPLSHCAANRLSEAALKNAWSDGLETWVPTVCGACPGGCGLLVRKIDDRAVKVEGNPLHPLNKGRVCPRGQASLQLLYNPARVRTPLLKVGARDSGEWREITWEEALETVASKLTALRNSGKSHTVAFLGPEGGGASDGLLSRFLKVYGTPNDLRIDPWESLKLAHSSAFGPPELMAFDLENCGYILSFGAQFLTNWPTSMETQRAYGEKRARRDLKIVQVEPRFSVCASRADRWIPIRPGTEGLLALGIASVILREKLYAEEFINRLAANFEDGPDERGRTVQGFKSAVLERIRLESVSDATGVPLRTIIETAREFSSAKPALALVDNNLSSREQGLFNALAVHSLNALVGSIDAPGGMVRQRRAPLKPPPEPGLDETARRGLLQPRVEPKALDSSLPIPGGGSYEINCLFVSSHALPYGFPAAGKWEAAARKIPLVVSFHPFLDRSNDFADLVLPESTFFEKWQLGEVPSLSMKTVVGVGQPVVKPLYQSRPFEDVIISLAKKMGAPLAENFPWPSHREWLSDRLSGLYDAKRGTVFLPASDEIQLKILEERGWWAPRHDSLAGFMKDLYQNGGWQDPVYHFRLRSHVYQNPQRRFVFFSPFIEGTGPAEPGPQDGGFPFQLYLYDLPFTAADGGAQMPFFQESLGFRFDLQWKTWVEINPAAAREADIRDGDVVWVESRHGKVKAVAKVFQGLMPEVVAMPLGKEEAFPPEKGAGLKPGPLVLLGTGSEARADLPARPTAWVKVYKTGGRKR